MMSRAVITVLSPTLAGNALLRTHMLLRLLRNKYDLQVVAFEAFDRIFEPLAEDPLLKDPRRYYAGNIAAWTWRVNRLAKTIRGDAIYCVKPMLGSFGAGLLLGRRLRRPVLLDIDDWERGFLSAAPYWEARTWGLRWTSSTASPLFTRLLDGFVYKASAVTVSNSFLQALYNGHWIPHARDASAFRTARAHTGDSQKTVLFAGSPRGHKGLPTLLHAWRQLRRKDAVLRLAVPDPSDTYLASLRTQEFEGVVVTGPHAWGDMPQIIATASVIVVPQDRKPGSIGQLPMKLMDAMAAGKPIIASDIGDAARWLEGGAGVTAVPGSAEALADALSALLDRPDVWTKMGEQAHARFCRLAGEDVLEARLCNIFARALVGENVPVIPAFAPELHDN